MSGYSKIIEKLDDKTGDFPIVHILMTSYNRGKIMKESLSSLFEHTDPTKYRLWISDDNSSDSETRQFLSSLSHPCLEAVILSNKRLGQHVGLNRCYYLIEDWIRHYQYPYSVCIVKTEDDILFSENWLETLVSVWDNSRNHNIGILGACNGARGTEVSINGRKVILTKHVAATCMFAPIYVWRTVLPIPWRNEVDFKADVDCRNPSWCDWMITTRGTNSIRSQGMTCGLVENLVSHIGGGKSTWREEH